MKQQSIDFTRAEQLGVIRRFGTRLPKTIPFAEGRKTISLAASSILAVLRAIDGYCGHKSACWASQETIANETGLSVRQVRRSIRFLDENGLITVKRRRQDTSIIKTVFANLVDFEFKTGHSLNQDRPQVATIEVKTGHQCRQDRPPVPLRPATVADRSDKEVSMKRHPFGRPQAAEATSGGVCVLEFEGPESLGDEEMANWQSVENELDELNIMSAEKLVAEISERIGPFQATQLISFFKEHRESNGWTPGALVHRLRSARGAKPINEGWPFDPKVINESKRQQREANQAKKRRDCMAEFAKEESKALEDSKRRVTLEQKHGGELDALSPDELYEFALREGGEFAANRIRSNPKCAIVRELLLESIDKSNDR